MAHVAIDWSKYMEGLAGKANIDADNFSVPGREELSGIGMPSSKFTELSLGAPVSTYTAPANGYYLLVKRTNADRQFIQIVNGVNTQERTGFKGGSSNNYFPRSKRNPCLC